MHDRFLNTIRCKSSYN